MKYDVFYRTTALKNKIFSICVTPKNMESTGLTLVSLSPVIHWCAIWWLKVPHEMQILGNVRFQIMYDFLCKQWRKGKRGWVQLVWPWPFSSEGKKSMEHLTGKLVFLNTEMVRDPVFFTAEHTSQIDLDTEVSNMKVFKRLAIFLWILVVPQSTVRSFSP